MRLRWYAAGIANTLAVGADSAWIWLPGLIIGLVTIAYILVKDISDRRVRRCIEVRFSVPRQRQEPTDGILRD